MFAPSQGSRGLALFVLFLLCGCNNDNKKKDVDFAPEKGCSLLSADRKKRARVRVSLARRAAVLFTASDDDVGVGVARRLSEHPLKLLSPKAGENGTRPIRSTSKEKAALEETKCRAESELMTSRR